MPGSKVKNWSIYHALRKKGYSKGRAASIANAPGPKKNKKRVPSKTRSKRRKRLKVK